MAFSFGVKDAEGSAPFFEAEIQEDNCAVFDEMKRLAMGRSNSLMDVRELSHDFTRAPKQNQARIRIMASSPCAAVVSSMITCVTAQ